MGGGPVVAEDDCQRRSQAMHRVTYRNGFTLIELLVVVAIISILASIAVPNFMEAQVRAKVGRTKADMRTLIVGIESYQLQNNEYPFRRNTQETATRKPHVPEYNLRVQQMSAITTPIAFLSSLPVDIFDLNVKTPNNIIDYYDPTQTSWFINYRLAFRPDRKVSPGQAGWLLVSVGPDKWLGATDNSCGTDPATPFELRGTCYVPYDPTNGTISIGNIFAGQVGGMDEAGNKITERSL